jgi:Domain of unknown function (DUF1963)
MRKLRGILASRTGVEAASASSHALPRSPSTDLVPSLCIRSNWWESMALSVEHLRSRLVEVGLEHSANELLGLARGSLRMQPDSTAAVAVGDSKLGGVPDLVPDTYWPQYNESLAFIAQINLLTVT